jgi:regulator of protease activity HflC (stomatin/prohibitin superfamily)
MMNLLRTSIGKIKYRLKNRVVELSAFFLVLLASFLILWPYFIKNIPAGSVGVIYKPLWGGVELDVYYSEGLRVILPWETLTIYDARLQQKTIDIEVLTSDLLKSTVTVSFQYQINAPTVPFLHKYIGKNYYEKVIAPQVINSVREQFAQYSSNNAFTADMRTVISDIIVDVDKILVEKVGPPGFQSVRLMRISNAQIANIIFPKEVQDAIEQKLVEAEKAEAYKYKLITERLEAQRKSIEAEGIRNFQDIIRPGLSENYLRWKGVEATQKLADSNNAKIIIFGSGGTGLPLVLGDMDKSGSSKK